ncbi:MAG: aspartate/glutamate racemase family protein [Parasphingorhabdus sp.]|uniref:aspartate/glutamate racemase family protein n=1 Tax=Parasphingorhabdus sp. TaxID=2709688 RepID=UPI0030017DAD
MTQSIRIWHQSFTVLSDLGAYNEALEEHFRRVSRPETEIVMHGMRPGTYRTNYPGDDIKYAGFQWLHGLQFLQNAIQAEADGFDAFALSTLPEPGLTEIRQMLSIPVVGYGESAARAAVRDGRKFGALVFIPDLAELYRANVRRYGLGCRLVGACPVGFGFADILAAFDDPDYVISEFKQSARALIAKGAEAIVPGEAPMNVILTRNGITEVDGVEVIDCLGTWVKAAESAVDLYRAEGAPSLAGYFEATPERERRNELLEYYGICTR